MTLAPTRIQLCGRMTVALDGRRVEHELPGRQGRILFAYLVVNRLRPASRGDLAHALWPERAPPNVDAALSALLSKLRRLVSLEGRSELRLILPPEAWIDLEAAREALHRAESAAGRAAWAEAWGPARVTQHVCARGFLPGEDCAWADHVRREVEELEVRALELVAEASLALGGSERDTAERAARRLVERAPYRESGYRALMLVLASRDNAAEALRVYERLRSRLRDDLGASPSPATQALHRRLLVPGDAHTPA